MKKRELTTQELTECAALKAAYMRQRHVLSLTQEKVADELGMNQGSFGHYLNGRNALNLEFASKISRILQVPVSEFSPRLADEMLLMANLAYPASNVIEGDFSRIREHSNVAPTQAPYKPGKAYPLISWVAAGGWMESCDNFEPGDAEEWISSEENAGQHGYWLEVKGRSMFDPSGQAPVSFPPGHRILVQPEGFDVISGKFYIARLRDRSGQWETTFKQYIRDAGVEYLQPINPSFETLKIDENVEIIGRIKDTRPPKSLL